MVRVVTSGLWEVISLPFCLLRLVWNQTWVHTRMMSGVSIPHCFLHLTGSRVHLRPSLWLARRMNPPPDQSVHWHLMGPPRVCTGGGTLLTGRWQPTLCLQSQASPQEILQEVASWDTRHWGNLAGSSVLSHQHRLRRIMSKCCAQEQRGLTLYTLASILQNQKARSNPYMVIFNCIGLLCCSTVS
jgi:hypothetical protein